MPERKTVVLFFVFGCISLFFLALSLLASFSSLSETELLERPAVPSQIALETAKDFVDSLVPDFDTRALRYQHIEYASSNEEILFLLKQYGAKEAKKLIKKEKLPFTYWVITLADTHRRRATLSIDSAQGSVIGYSFSSQALEETAHEMFALQDAENLSRGFLEKTGLAPSDFELEDIEKNTASLRDGYEITWSRKNLLLKGMRLLFHMTVKDGKVVSFSSGLTLPKSFSRAYAKSLFLSESVLGASIAFWLLLAVILLALAIVKRKSLEYGRARLWASCMGPLFLIHFANEQSSYVWYIDALRKLSGALFFTALAFMLVSVTGTLFRTSFKRGIETVKESAGIPSFVLIGYSLSFIMLFAVLLFYALMEHSKIIWDVGADEIVGALLTSKVFYLAPVLLGIIPAFTEEFFRGFWIALFKKVTARTFFAIAVSALIWGFAHTATDGSSFPGYIAGIEKSLTGIVIGYALVSFGIETVILWHFLNNFIASALLLFVLGGNFRFYAMGCAVLIFLPFFAAVYFYFNQPAHAIS